MQWLITPHSVKLANLLNAELEMVQMRSRAAEGVRISSHSARRAADAVGADINGGRGDRYQSVYAGLNCYVCGDNVKAMVGFQWDDIESKGVQYYRGLTTCIALS